MPRSQKGDHYFTPSEEGKNSRGKHRWTGPSLETGVPENGRGRGGIALQWPAGGERKCVQSAKEKGRTKNRRNTTRGGVEARQAVTLRGISQQSISGVPVLTAKEGGSARRAEAGSEEGYRGRPTEGKRRHLH